MDKAKVRKGCLVAAGIALVAVGGFLMSSPGRAFLDIWRTGAVQDAVAGVGKGDYRASNEGNLKAIYTALELYHESEGQYPRSEGWMDAIENRLGVNDLKEEESRKKLVRPDLLGRTGQYGYAFNNAASGKYKGDLKPGTPLVFESDDLSRNAHGVPGAKRRGGACVSIEGRLERLEE